jgi:type VI secretion system secreted protein VgrG
MGVFTQTHRLLSASVESLGEDALLLCRMKGTEALSQLFHYRLEFLSEHDAIAARDVIGQPISWCLNPAADEPRYFHGMVRRFGSGARTLATASPGGAPQDMRWYWADVVPWLWFLTRTADCRIFQNEDAKAIIETIFNELGFKDYEFSLRRACPKREYCVQYRETAFHFVSRLLEEEGIFYFFRHDRTRHTLVLADQASAYEPCPESPVHATPRARRLSHIHRWEHRYEFRSGKCAQTDYNFTTPAASLMTSTNTLVDLPNVSRYELFDYPGLYSQEGVGSDLVKIRMEEEETSHDVVEGASNCATFTPGGKFTLDTHDSEAEVGKGYVLTSTVHEAEDLSYVNTNGTQKYDNAFTCVPDHVMFRPARTTRKPAVGGPQTAVVVGPRGEEIHVDKYGRVTVQFFWDRKGKKDENSSCWIRVAESWAGKNWGIVFHPRVGQEVVVDFLEGDPDRPLITGRVYNDDQMPPYDLPAHKTQSGVKSRSSDQGSTDHFNELRFEDRKDAELIYFHAEKDFSRVVENNDTLKVGFDKKDKGDQTVTIFNNQSLTVGCQDAADGSQTVSVYKDRTTTVETGNETLTVKKGKRTVQVQGDDTLTVTTGDLKVDVSKGKVGISAMQSIELKCGPSSIKIDPTGITLKGLRINVQGQALALVEGGVVVVKARSLLQAKGAITMIG